MNRQTRDRLITAACHYGWESSIRSAIIRRRLQYRLPWERLLPPFPAREFSNPLYHLWLGTCTEPTAFSSSDSAFTLINRLSAFAQTQLAPFHLFGGVSSSPLFLPHQPFTISAPTRAVTLRLHYNAYSPSPSHDLNRSLAPSIPIQLARTRPNVRSVTLLPVTCIGSRDGFLAPSSFPLSYLYDSS